MTVGAEEDNGMGGAVGERGDDEAVECGVV